MPTTFTFESYAKELEKEAELPKRALEVIRRVVKLEGPRAVEAEFSALTQAPVDRGTYRRDFRFENTKDGATMYNFALYAAIIEWGRRPGAKAPPIQAIFEWVKRKGIGSSLIGPVQQVHGPRQQGGRRRSDRQDAVERQQWWIAIEIARKIKARGLPPHLILDKAAYHVDVKIREEIDKLLEGASA